MEAKVTFVEGMQFVGEASSGHALVMDAPAEVGGSDTGLRPMELLLIGLGGCSGMDVISILRKKKQDVIKLEIFVTGNKADAHPKKFTDITIKYVVKGRNISKEAVKRAVELSMDKYCSVKATIEVSAKVQFSYEIVQEQN